METCIIHSSNEPHTIDADTARTLFDTFFIFSPHENVNLWVEARTFLEFVIWFLALRFFIFLIYEANFSYRYPYLWFFFFLKSRFSLTLSNIWTKHLLRRQLDGFWREELEVFHSLLRPVILQSSRGLALYLSHDIYLIYRLPQQFFIKINN